MKTLHFALAVKPVAPRPQSRIAPRIEIPNAEGPARLGRIGLIAIFGFALGIVWPKLLGVRLVPAVPAENAAKEALPAAPSSALPAGLAIPAPESKPRERFSLRGPELLSCRDARGRRVQTCDRVDVDGLLRPALSKIGTCPGTASIQGALNLELELNLDTGSVRHLESNNDASLTTDEVEIIIDCARTELKRVALAGIPHQNSSYTFAYPLEFERRTNASPTPVASVNPADEIVPASGEATVIWDLALVRKSPAREGNILGKLVRGTRVSVNARKADWYRAKFDAAGNQGWIYRGAIGL